MTAEEIIAKKTCEIDKIIYSFLPVKTAETAIITDAVEYSVRAGGKRIRPMLMQQVFQTFAGTECNETLYAFMAAIEFIHTYSLVHDDLPAMDNDMYRRGKLSTHAAFGHAAGVLAGDALLNLAFETAVNAVAKPASPITQERAVLALKVIADKSGINGMVGGQCLDVFSEQSDKQLSEQEIMYIYHGKTSALLQASLMAGAILGGADCEEVAVLEETGEYIGLAFQIRDDILDITSTTQELGKPVGSDASNGKQTYALRYGIDKAQALVEEYSARAIDSFDSLKHDNDLLKGLIRYLSVRNK